MTLQSCAKVAGAVATFVAIVLAGMSIKPLRAHADNDDDTDSRVRIGFKIAPVHLNLDGKDRHLVGLGSYLVNAAGDCNGCYSANAPPIFLYPYTTGRNPYFDQPEKIDPAVYLSGGRELRLSRDSNRAFRVRRSKHHHPKLDTGQEWAPEGGHTFSEFKEIMRHGKDFDQIHPTCTAEQVAEILTGATPVCIPTGPILLGPGVSYNNIPDGNLLQIMPWATFSHMSDHDIEANYEYLSAIPCIDNTTSPPPTGAPNELRNDCGAADDDVKDSGNQHSMRSHRSH
ncbi:MAG: hypothetical protein WB660_00610 [Candidatus Sulfotelmatobacter sp.]